MNRKVWVVLWAFLVLALATVSLSVRASGAAGQPAPLEAATSTRVAGTLPRMWLPVVFREYTILFLPTPTPTTTPTPTRTPTRIYTPVAGKWTGTTNRGYAVSFDVSTAAIVSNFLLTTDYSAPSCGVSSDTLTFLAQGPCEIVKNRFGTTTDTFAINGMLTSSSRATGTYAFTNFPVTISVPFPPYTCSFSFTQSGTWSASPAPTPTPTPTPVPFTLILQENFEGAFPGPWTLKDNIPGSGEYMWGKRNCRPYPGGTYSGWAVGGGEDGALLPCGSNYLNNVSSWMIYGPFDLTGATSAELTFKAWLDTEPGADWLYWAASTDGLYFNGLSTSGNSGGWVSERLDLANVPTLGNLLGRHQVWIAFIFESNDIATYPEGVYVDNMVLRKCLAARCVDAAGMAPESDWQVSPLPLGTATLHLEK